MLEKMPAGGGSDDVLTMLVRCSEAGERSNTRIHLNHPVMSTSQTPPLHRPLSALAGQVAGFFFWGGGEFGWGGGGYCYY